MVNGLLAERRDRHAQHAAEGRARVGPADVAQRKRASLRQQDGHEDDALDPHRRRCADGSAAHAHLGEAQLAKDERRREREVREAAEPRHVERRARVARALERRRSRRLDEGERKQRQHHVQVRPRVAEHGRVGARKEQPQERPVRDEEHSGDPDPAHKREHERAPRRARSGGPIARADRARDDGERAGRERREKRVQRPRERPGDLQRREPRGGVLPDEHAPGEEHRRDQEHVRDRGPRERPHLGGEAARRGRGEARRSDVVEVDHERWGRHARANALGDRLHSGTIVDRARARGHLCCDVGGGHGFGFITGGTGVRKPISPRSTSFLRTSAALKERARSALPSPSSSSHATPRPSLGCIVTCHWIWKR